ncbi:aminopeptidase [Ruminococcaceae bacterium OttesenSCG-928-O06]|nr:aminopeptidase [Ruminococcaceae bacterium OttesenSCG-928-O06]
MPKEAKKEAKTAKKAEKLAGEILAQAKHFAAEKPDEVKKALAFCGPYKAYLDASKTERECAANTVRILQKAGYKPFVAGKKLAAGDKVYLLHRGKAVIAATLGKQSLEKGVRMVISHIDSPRLDLKPAPLYEAEELSYFKTHYYGGVRKYQWVAIPLSMHGVVVKKDGTSVEISLGEAEGDPVFTITDLLPHLSAEQNKRSLADGIRGEELNILVGALPFEEPEAKEAVKLETMRLLHEKYGIAERDFARAEIEFVPAMKAADVGFDGSMVGAYGQDDRVCAYTSLMAETETKSPEFTSVCVMVDKEETGSDGNTGLAGDFFFHFLQELCEQQKANYRTMLAASVCLSADVNAAYDPTFPDVYEKRNTCFMNHGAVLTKYTGARGKGSTSDASAEFMGYVTRLFDDAGVPWQIGELGKVDAGGGGTIAKFVANKNVEVVDIGVPVLSMHSPFEITSKLDVYTLYQGFKAFVAAKE